MIWNGKYWQFDVFKNIKNYAELMTEEMKIEAFSLTDLEQQKEILKNVCRHKNNLAERTGAINQYGLKKNERAK